MEQKILDELKTLTILTRVNNLLLSKFILQMAAVREKLDISCKTFFRFEILEEEYNSLVEEFGEQEVDKAMYRLDRLLLQNKQQVPHNIKKYLKNKLRKSRDGKEAYKKFHNKQS